MPRVPRSSFETSFFHVIIQGVNREYIFNKKEYIEAYLSLLDRYKKEYNISILAYCIMNNHAHLLIYTEEIQNMGKLMHKINGIYGQYYNKNENRVGIVFRNRYVSEPIYNAKYLAQCINYIHMNPVKAGMVQKSEEYKYSSSREYKSNTGVARTKILIDVFGKDFSGWLNTCEFERMFMDIEIDRGKLLNEGIKRFEKIKGKNIEDILKYKDAKRELIIFLKKEYKIKYVEIMKKFDITKAEIIKLVK